MSLVERSLKRECLIGLAEHLPYIEMVLDQLGIDYLRLSSLSEGIDRGVNIFFCDEKTEVLDTFRKPLPYNMVLITCHHVAGKLLRKPVSAVKRSYYFSIRDNLSKRSIYINLPVMQIDAGTAGTCFDEVNVPIKNSGIFHSTEIPSLEIWSLPWNLFILKLGEYWGYRPYYSYSAKKHFVEVGPHLDLGALRRLLFEILIRASRSLQSAIYYRPPRNVHQNVCVVRVDADGYSDASTTSTLRIAQSVCAKFTWFIDVLGWGENLRYAHKLLSEEGQEVQLHCYKHMVYYSRNVNHANLTRGIKKLQSHHVLPQATAAPLGLYTRAFAEVIEKLGLTYSSEFAYAVDDLPSHPSNSPGSPLQIPVHPGSIGVFEMSGFTVDEIFQHYDAVVRGRNKCDGVAIIYDHPLGRIEKYEKEFIAFLKNLKSDGFEIITMGQYYSLWKAREGIQKERLLPNLEANSDILKYEDTFCYPDNIYDIRQIIEKRDSVLKEMNENILQWYYKLMFKQLKNTLRSLTNRY